MEMRKSLPAVAAGLMLALSGCEEAGNVSASTSPSSAQIASSSSVQRGKTSEELKLEREVRNLNQITQDIVVSNTIQGALAGAAIGCLIGHMTRDNCGQGALAGGLLGGVAGNQVGQQAAQAKRELVAADQTIAKLKGINTRLNSVESQLRGVVSRQNSEIASLQRQLAAGQVSRSAFDSRVSAINSNRQEVINGLAASEKNVAEERAQLVSAEREGGQQLTSTKAAVDSTRSRIASMRQSVNLISS